MLINRIPYVQVGQTKGRPVARYAGKLACKQERLEKGRQVSR